MNGVNHTHTHIIHVIYNYLFCLKNPDIYLVKSTMISKKTKHIKRSPSYKWVWFNYRGVSHHQVCMKTQQKSHLER